MNGDNVEQEKGKGGDVYEGGAVVVGVVVVEKDVSKRGDVEGEFDLRNWMTLLVRSLLD